MIFVGEVGVCGYSLETFVGCANSCFFVHEVNAQVVWMVERL